MGLLIIKGMSLHWQRETHKLPENNYSLSLFQSALFENFRQDDKSIAF